MKLHHLIPFAVAIVTMGFSDGVTQLTDAERKYATQLLQDTRKNLLQKVNGLTTEQLNFKPDENTWSVAECVEHIALSENNIFGFAQSSLQQTADASQKSEVKMTDEAIVKFITDRTTKVKTQEPFEPGGKFGNFEGSLAEFKTKRDDHINYVKTTSDDLRNHFNDFPFGKIDTYQTILFMAGHTKRHTDQIEEVMKNSKFPKRK